MVPGNLPIKVMDNAVMWNILQNEKGWKLEQNILTGHARMISNKGRYFLVGNYDGYDDISHYRLDRITDVEILKESRKPMKSVKGLENGLNITDYISEHVYMFSGESVHVKLRADENLMGTLIDNFGKDFRVTLGKGHDIIVDLKCNPDAFFYWVMQYGEHTEVLEPASMRKRIQQTAKAIQMKYS
ncbi:MAG: WYL domain-containing protein [Butyrivibrio sp.]|nr:WYL domain-containing protein [Butyrivibrio sp.]